MEKALGALLFGLMLFLSIGIVSIAGTAARESGLAAAEIPSPRNRRIGHIAMAVGTVLVVTILAFGNLWLNAQADDLKHTVLYSAPPLRFFFDQSDSTRHGMSHLTLLFS